MSTDKATPRTERWNLHHERTRMYTERIDVRNEDCDTLFSLGPDDTVEIEDGAIVEVCSKELIARARLIVASVNHAEKLAEALRDCASAIERMFPQAKALGRNTNDATLSATKARAALDAYEKDLNAK